MRSRLAVPSAFVVASSWLGCSGPAPDPACVIQEVPDASVRTYECKDGRSCGTPDPTAIDGGGIYQVCPGQNECETLVNYDGTSMSGFC
jgi:hypothetical protein